MKTLKNASKKQKIELIGGVLLLAIFVLPFLTFASSRNSIYVDGSRTGIENGTPAYPFHTISAALASASDKTDVHVANGIYKDNIEIPKGVRVFGSSTSGVILQARDRNKVVVSMKDDTRINKFTIEKGREGIWVKKDAEVSIIKCVIKNNKKDGIKIESGSTKKKDGVTITDNKIKNNGRNGIFSQKRRIALEDNEIYENESDGVGFAAGVSAWIENNEFRDNDGSGLKIALDGSDIWTKSNTFNDNSHSGVEVNAKGKTGRVDISKSKFSNNENFGIARISRLNAAASVWNGLTVSNTTFKMTRAGEISPILQIR